jgi:hypothetical protein
MQPNPPNRPPFLAAADPGITPPGWYTVSDGRVLWWDGNQWVVVPQQGQQQAVQPHPTTMVTTSPVETNHVFHLLMTCITCGFWFPIWMVVTWLNALSKKKQTTTIR